MSDACVAQWLEQSTGKKIKNIHFRRTWLSRFSEICIYNFLNVNFRTILNLVKFFKFIILDYCSLSKTTNTKNLLKFFNQ